MICECCKRKMMEGYIPAAGLWWVPKEREQELEYRSSGQEADSLETRYIKKETAYYCLHCDRIVIDCKGMEEK